VTRLLIDENLPPSLATLLRQAGHDAVHVNQVGLARTEDPTIMARAMQEGRTVVTLDRDYPHLLRDGAEGPSVIRIDQRGGRAVAGLVRQAEVLQAALPKLDAYLMEGASVTLDARGVRVDPLPLGRSGRGLDPGGADRHPAGSVAASRSGRDASHAGRDASPAAPDLAPAGRDVARSGREPSHAGRDAAGQRRERVEGIGREQGRRAHPASRDFGR